MYTHTYLNHRQIQVIPSRRFSKCERGTYTYICVCVYICIYVYMCVCVCVCVFMYIYMYTLICIHMYLDPQRIAHILLSDV